MRWKSVTMYVEDGSCACRYVLTNNFTCDPLGREESRILITKIPFRHTRMPPRCKLRAHAMRGWQHTRDRYKPRAGVSLICLMSRYCNDFASDLRLFIYSPAVLADRTLITGASRYTNGIKVPAPAHRTQPFPLPRLRRGEAAARISWTS